MFDDSRRPPTVRPFLLAENPFCVMPPAVVPTNFPDEVRPYLQTGGRVQPVDTLELEAQVVTTELGRAALGRLRFEPHDIVALCLEPNSVAEVAAKLRLHVSVARIVVADITADGYLTIVRPGYGERPPADTLERVIRGLEAIS